MTRGKAALGMGASCRAPTALLLFCYLLCLSNFATAHGAKKLLIVRSVQLETSGNTQIVLSTTTFNPSSQPVSVTARVQRLPNRASSDDVVALYTHPSDPRSTLPVTWRNLTASSPGYAATGSGSVTFQLLNFRQNFIVRLVRNNTFSPVVLAESAVIKNANPNAPGQVHPALHADGSSVVVQWVSGSAAPQQLQYSSTAVHFAGLSLTGSTGTTTADVQPHPLLYSSGGSGATVVLSTVRSYDRHMMCGEPATTFGFIHPGYMHTAVIPGKEVGHSRRLHYRVGSPEVGWSEAFNFTSAPEPAAVAKGKASFTFLVFNDVGQENSVLFNDTCPPYCPGGWAWVNYTTNSTKLVQHLMREQEARLGLLIGDLSYANGVQADWDYFGHQFQAPFSRWPLMVATGNHERDQPHTSDVLKDSSSDSGGECNVPYTYRYYTPAWEVTDPYAHKGALGRSSTSSASTSNGRASKSNINTTHKGSKNIGSTGSSGRSIATSSNSGRGPVDAQQHHLLASWTRTRPDKQGIDRLQKQQLLQNLPTALNPYKSYYSFSMATVHFLMLDSESPSHKGSPQHSFVVQDLAKVDRRKHPWLVVGLHRMMAGPTTDPVNVQNMARLQADYEELFKQHAVDLVLQGHEHAYARTCPLYKGKCIGQPEDSNMSRSSRPRHGGSTLTSRSQTTGSNGGSSKGSPVLHLLQNPQAPVYVLAGHAGAGFTHAFPDVLPGWVAFGVQDQNGYVRVNVSGGKLTLESISTDDGHVIDGVQIVKKAAASGRVAASKQKYRQL